MTASDNETGTTQMVHWLEEGHATWGCRIGKVWTDFPLYETGAHPLAEVLERHLPERAA